MRRLILAGLVLALAVLTGCGTSTQTVTVQRPPNLGQPRADAHETMNGRTGNGDQTFRVYRPKHGHAEQANYYNASGCGVERWAIKTATDPAANQVNLTPQETSIADLVSIAPPVSPTDRVGPTETQAFRLSGTLIFAKAEADSDYHLVVEDAQSNTMIVESPNPGCANGSLVLKQIEGVRSAIDQRLPEIGRGQIIRPNIAVTVTGIGFFDRVHGQTGVAKNGLELHPCLSIQFTSGQKTTSRSPLRLVEQPGTD